MQDCLVLFWGFFSEPSDLHTIYPSPPYPWGNNHLWDEWDKVLKVSDPLSSIHTREAALGLGVV